MKMICPNAGIFNICKDCEHRRPHEKQIGCEIECNKDPCELIEEVKE